METTIKTCTTTPDAPPLNYAQEMARGQAERQVGNFIGALDAYMSAITLRRRSKVSSKDAVAAYLAAVADLRERCAYANVSAAIDLDDEEGTNTALAVAYAKHVKNLGRRDAPEFIAAAQIVNESLETQEEAVMKTKTKKAPKAVDSTALEKLETDRAKKNGLKVGATVKHTVRGEVQAECVYVAPRQWRYKRNLYTSNSAAANACAADLGSKSASLNGWNYWGIEKREA